MTLANPTIRLATSADAPRVAALAARTFRETYAAELDRTELELHIARTFNEQIQRDELCDPRRLTLLLTDASDELGYAQLRSAPAPGGLKSCAALELQRFYLAQHLIGRGAARPFMDAVKAAARERGAELLWLGVWERNPRAIAFYKKCGFALAGETRFPFGSAQLRDLVMCCELGDSS